MAFGVSQRWPTSGRSPRWTGSSRLERPTLPLAIVEGPLFLPKKSIDRLGAVIGIYSMSGADCGPRLRDWLTTGWDSTINNIVDDARKTMPEKRPGS